MAAVGKTIPVEFSIPIVGVDLNKHVYSREVVQKAIDKFNEEKRKVPVSCASYARNVRIELGVADNLRLEGDALKGRVTVSGGTMEVVQQVTQAQDLGVVSGMDLEEISFLGELVNRERSFGTEISSETLKNSILLDVCPGDSVFIIFSGGAEGDLLDSPEEKIISSVRILEQGIQYYFDGDTKFFTSETFNNLIFLTEKDALAGIKYWKEGNNEGK